MSTTSHHASPPRLVRRVTDPQAQEARRQLAVQRVLEGETRGAVAASLKVSDRSIRTDERYTLALANPQGLPAEWADEKTIWKRPTYATVSDFLTTRRTVGRTPMARPRPSSCTTRGGHGKGCGGRPRTNGWL